LSRSRTLGHPWLEFATATVAAFLLTLLAFGPGLRAAFVSDDVNAIVENEWVAGDLDAAGILRNFSWWGAGRSDSRGYRPAATLSFALSRAASGSEPYGFRIVNYALNALCAGLLFALARVLGLGLAAAGAAAALFAVLPIHSEAVIWIVGRAELGATAGFLLAALLCVLVRQREATRGTRQAAWPLLVGAAGTVAVGMAFKENAVTALALPAIFLLCAGPVAAAAPRVAEPERAAAKKPTRSRAAAGRGATTTRAAPAAAGFDDSVPGSNPAAWSGALVATGALAVGAAAYLVLRALAAGPPPDSKAITLLDNPLAVVDVATRLLGAVAVLGRYVALTLWPASLSVDYSYDALGIGPGFRANGDSLVALAFLAAAAWAWLRAPGRRDVVRAGLLMTAASYSIVSNTVFVLGTILGERLFYLPTAGLCLAAVAMAEPLLPAASRGAWRPASVAAATVLVAMVVAATMVGRERATDWMTPVSLFEAAVATVPRSARARMELASAYGTAGRVDEALPHFAAALEIDPTYAAAAYNQANAFAHARRFEEAAAGYRKALAIAPRLTRAWHNLALTERILGRTDAWIEAMRGAAASSSSPTLQDELGEALIAAGRYAEAVETYDAMAASGTAGAASWFNRGVARHHLGGCNAAVEDYRRATAAAGAPAAAFAAAAGCLRELQRNDEAVAVEQAAKVANRDTRR